MVRPVPVAKAAAGLVVDPVTRFEKALGHVLKVEGGFVNHPDDPGGATNFGVTQAVYDAWRRTVSMPTRSVRNISHAEVRTIYHTHYWITARCELLPEPIGEIHFDGAVNHGPTQAARILQRAAGVPADGIIGPVTVGAAERMHPDQLLMSRIEFYRAICNRRPASRAFLLGWLNRIASVRDAYV